MVLDGLIARVRSLVVPGLVNWSPRGEDRRKVQETLAAKDSAYVLMTDVASFYEYVDHDVLADELLELTGDESGVSALSGLLGELMRSRRGLPQGPLSVGDLADVYLSAVDRRLVRDDFELYRFTDDYRLPCSPGSLPGSRGFVWSVISEMLDSSSTLARQFRLAMSSVFHGKRKRNRALCGWTK